MVKKQGLLVITIVSKKIDIFKLLSFFYSRQFQGTYSYVEPIFQAGSNENVLLA